MDIIHRRSGLSLRIIDWLATNYSKHTHITVHMNGIATDLYKDYHKNLSTYNKRNFDPFARRRRIGLIAFDGKTMESTIGQLNFFKWFISKDLLPFLLANKEHVETHMKGIEKQRKCSKENYQCPKTHDHRKCRQSKRSTHLQRQQRKHSEQESQYQSQQQQHNVPMEESRQAGACQDQDQDQYRQEKVMSHEKSLVIDSATIHESDSSSLKDVAIQPSNRVHSKCSHTFTGVFLMQF
jgi:hypothetical protein